MEDSCYIPYVSNDMKHCFQCQKPLNDTYNRLVWDSCGHHKCRTCLLQEDHQCKMCASERSQNHYHPVAEEQPDITYLGRSLPTDLSIRSEHSAQESIEKKSENNNVNISTALHQSPSPHKGHSSEININCMVCKRAFDKSSYMNHIYEHFGAKMFFCNVCGRFFQNRSKTARHMLIHSGVKEYKCSTCSAHFNNAYSLKKHNLIHSGIKPFNCQYCNAAFRDSSNLRKHELNHKNFMYSCSECDKQYKTKWSLVIHIRSHKNDMPWTCSFCPKAFYTKKDMNRHELTHTDIRRIVCMWCDSRFRRKDSLDRHVRNRHSQALQKCIPNKKTEFNDGKSNSIQEEIKNNVSSNTKCENEARLKILEANIKRESVIFKFSPEKRQICDQSSFSITKTIPISTSVKAIEDNIEKMQTNHDISNILIDNETNSSSPKLTNDNKFVFDKETPYIHKKMHYDIKKLIMPFSKYPEFNDEIARRCMDQYSSSSTNLNENNGQKSYCSPESRERYKKILCLSYNRENKTSTDV